MSKSMIVFFTHPAFWVLGITLILSVSIYLFVHLGIRRLLPENVLFPDGKKRIFHYFSPPFKLLLPAVILRIALPAMRLPAYLDPVLSLVVGLWFIGAVSWMCLAAVEILSEWILSRYDLASKNNLEARKIYTQLRVLKRIIDVVILIIAVSCVLMSFERIRQLGVSLLASAGVVGIILGFAAQRSIATLFAGLQIAITQPIRLDDVVIVENEWGWIEEITLTHVVVKIWDLRRLVVPITYFIERPFQNWTRISADILGTVFLYADYKVPVESLREELHRILKSTPLWDQKAWCLQVTNVTADTVELRALMSATNSPEAWDLRCLVREKLLAFLQKRHPEHLPRTRVELDRTPPAPGTPKNDPSPPSPPDASKTG